MSKFNMDVIEVLGHVRGNEDGWGIGVMKMAWGDNPTTLDIRNVNLVQERAGKGVSLSDTEAERLVEILLDNNYGTIESLKEAINRRESIFDYGELVNQNDSKDGIRTVEIIIG